MRVDVFGVVYQTKLAKQQIAKEFEMVQEYSSRLSLVKTREVSSKLIFYLFQQLPIKVGQSEKNQNRNRFVDIIPYDDNYVSLQVHKLSSHISKVICLTFQKEQGLPPSTYVNASYVDDLDGVGKVIVTQVIPPDLAQELHI